MTIDLRCGRAEDLLPTLPDASVDVVVTDPIYPCVDRSYGRMEESEWHEMMHAVVRHCRRVLKPHGSAVFILQPNSRKVGSMRLWLFEFIVWAGKEWNLVQDAWWWNITAPPMTRNDPNLLRSSLKACVWLGSPDCYRNGSEILWSESDGNKAHRVAGRLSNNLKSWNSSKTTVREAKARTACLERGGVTSFNVLPFRGYCDSGHPAGTPEPLANWWIRYLSRPGDVVLDPFVGSGTMAVAALKLGRHAIGFDQVSEFVFLSRCRCDAVQAATPLFPAGVP